MGHLPLHVTFSVICCAPYLRNRTSSNHSLWYAGVKSNDDISRSFFSFIFFNLIFLIGYNSYTKVALNLLEKFPFWVRAISVKFGPILCNRMSHDSLSEDLFEVLWHDNADKAQYRWLKVALVIFPKFRNILSRCGVIDVSHIS